MGTKAISGDNLTPMPPTTGIVRSRKYIRPWPIAIMLLLLMAAEVILSTRQESPSWDEGDHIYAGYMNWKHDNYSLNPEHPPLVKLIATLPLLGLQLKVPPRQGRYFKSEAYYGGHALLFRNGRAEGGSYTADSLLLRTHMAVLVFGLALALLLFVAGREMFGAGAGLIAMALFVFDPTVLTNAPFVTTDMGGACGFFASIYIFYRLVKLPSWPRAVACGVVLGFTLGTKHSMIVLPLLLPMLAAVDWLAQHRFRKLPTIQQLTRAISKQLGVLAIAFFVLWALYSFRFAMHPSGVDMPSFANQISPLSPTMQKLLSFFARCHLLPESYLYGLADVEKVGMGMPTYIFGRLYAHGQWFYFPAILSLKWSAGVLGLFLLSFYAFASGKRQYARELWFLGASAVFYLGVAMASPLNIGVRHVLPLFPLVFLLIGAGSSRLIARREVWVFPVACLLLWHMTDSVLMFPNYMPYANIFWGGPTKTHLYFSDSATEWGQELKWTRRWTDNHHVKACWFAYFPAPFLLPSDYGIPCKLLPTLDTMYEGNIPLPKVVHGPLLISFADLNGFEFGSKVRNPYQRLFERTPDDVIANGVAVYYGDFELPGAASLQYIQAAQSLLKAKPEESLKMAQQAVIVTPDGFDANLALGDALLGTHDPGHALRAYKIAENRLADMEPSARAKWTPIVKKKLMRAGETPS
jgi:hypothetical protein